MTGIIPDINTEKEYDFDVHLVYGEKEKILEYWYRHVGDYRKPPAEEVLHRRFTKDGG